MVLARVLRAALGVAVLVAAAASPSCYCGGTTRLVGEVCVDNGDCADLCATGPEFPDGHCTVRCVDDRDCPGDTLCVDVQGGICLFDCAGADAGYCFDMLGAGYSCRDQDTFDGRVVLVCMGD